jgi:DNA repair protein RecO (recombination protein O)
MEWSDQGLILGMRRHGEASVILEAMTARHGRHLGLVRGGRSSRMRALLQTGNSVGLTWRARLEDHLGNYTVEPQSLRAGKLIDSPLALSAIQTLAGHLRLLPERDPHPGLLAAAEVVLDHLDDAGRAAALLARFELELLDELGFGLDLSRCALTGTTSGLAWVSPVSGKAASREAGARWAGKLLVLPGFLAERNGGEASATVAEIRDAFALTGHFLQGHVWQPRGIAEPAERTSFIRLATREPVANGGRAASSAQEEDR